MQIHTKVSVIGSEVQRAYFMEMVTHPGNVIEGINNIYSFEYTHENPDATIYVYDPSDSTTYNNISASTNNIFVAAAYYGMNNPIIYLDGVVNFQLLWCEECWLVMEYIINKVHSIQPESLMEIVYDLYNG